MQRHRLLLFLLLLLTCASLVTSRGVRRSGDAGGETDVGVNVGPFFNMGLFRDGGRRFMDLGIDVLSGLVRVGVNRDGGGSKAAGSGSRSVFVDVGGQPVVSG